MMTRTRHCVVTLAGSRLGPKVRCLPDRERQAGITTAMSRVWLLGDPGGEGVSVPKLFDSDASAFVPTPGEMVNAVVDKLANAAQEFDSGFTKVLACRFGRRERIGNCFQAFAYAVANCIDVRGSGRAFTRGLLAFGHDFCPSSTTSIRPSRRALRGTSAAIVVGRPTCLRMVPTSTTSSSSFLKSPISTFSVNGRSSRTS